jgi:glycine oxidase
LALVARGVRVDLVSRDRPGASSRAAAGLLVPSIEGGQGPAHDFAIAARDLYPEFLYGLRSSVGARIEFSRAGILDVAVDEATEQRLRDAAAGRHTSYLTPNEIASLEPRLAPTRGGLLAELDGYVDNVALMDALEAATRAAHPRLREIDGLVSRLELARDSASLVLELGDRVNGAAVVLAAGAWSPTIDGLPRPLPVRPLKGQMISFDPPEGATGALIEHAIYGAGVYLAPRGGRRTLVGATSEEAGFDTSLTDAAAQGLERGVKTLLPQLETSTAADHWSGIRPMSFDALPFLGTDPEFAALIYACGHSRNGILKAPITGEVIASLFTGGAITHDLTPFSPVRHQAVITTSSD